MIRRRFFMGSAGGGGGVPSLVHNTKYLYYLGDQCVGDTGGWSKNTISGETNDTVTLESDHIYERTAGYGRMCYCATNDPVVTTGFDKAICQFDYSWTNFSGTPSSYKGVGLAQRPARGSRVTGVVDLLTTIPDAAATVDKQFYVSSVPLRSGEYIQFIIDNGGLTGGIITTKTYMVAVYKSDDLSGLQAYGYDAQTIIANAESLLADSAAVTYMVQYCTGAFMWAALGDAGFVNALNNSPNESIVLSNDEWSKALALI